MNDKGFSLLEMLVVITIMVTLLAIGTLQFNDMTRKANIEKQTRQLQADLMKVRSEALLQKRPRAVTFASTATQTIFSMYSSTNTAVGVGPVAQDKLNYVMEPAPVTISFDQMGIADSTSFNILVDPHRMALCVTSNDSQVAYDSIVVSQTMITVGKRQQGQNCTYDKVDQK